MNKSNKITIYFDGGCRNNGSPSAVGAWAWYCPEIEKSETGGEVGTTNNKMELQAAISALTSASCWITSPAHITMVGDSKYVIQGITEWVLNWIKRGWKTADRKEVKNQLSWEVLNDYKNHLEARGITIEWQHCAGHAGLDGNEYVDRLCNEKMDEMEQGFDSCHIDLSRQLQQEELNRLIEYEANMLRITRGIPLKFLEEICDGIRLLGTNIHSQIGKGDAYISSIEIDAYEVMLYDDNGVAYTLNGAKEAIK